MQTDEAQVLFADTMHGVPNIRSVLGNRKLRTGEPWRYHYGKFFDLVANGVPGHFPPLPVSALYNNSLLDAYDMVLDGRKTPEQALRDVKTRVQSELERYP
jgi:ABC-type glycerol-3-phosphate transport system substrate-binding protein